MHRRRYLTLVGLGTTTLAGCAQPSLSDTNDSTEPTSTVASPTTVTTSTDDELHRLSMGETVTHDELSVTVGNLRVRNVIATRGVHTRLVTPELITEGGDSAPGQFLVVDIRIDGEPAAELDRLRLFPTMEGQRVPESSPVSVADAAGRYGFPVPTRVPEAASIRWDTGDGSFAWSLSADIRRSLGSEPSFRIEDVSVPREEGDLVLKLTVRNDGDRAGRFIARVSQADFSGGDIVTFTVSAGEARSETVSPGVLLYVENAGGGTLTIRYAGRSGLETIEHPVDVATTTTESAD